MPFVPARKLESSQRSNFYVQLKTGQKRKRDVDSQESDSGSDLEDELLASRQHPVSAVDPYRVAGYPREKELPPPPFPYAAEDHNARPDVSIADELAKLRPPILTTPGLESKQPISLRHRHLDNLVTILYTRMLERDWERASRVFGLLVRTRLSSPLDIRIHDRWTLAGEILLHRDSIKESQNSAVDDVGQSAHGHYDKINQAGCQSARDFYEKMILSYPHRQSVPHAIDETAIYPILFNVWIYEVQDKAKQARRVLTEQADNVSLFEISHTELDEASEIATRMDELIAAPPYESDANLLRLRGMVALWIAVICKDLTRQNAERIDEDTQDSHLIRSPVNDLDANEWRSRAASETEISRRMLSGRSGQD